MEKKNKVNVKNIFRWIAFLPVAIIAGFIGYNIIWFMHELSNRWVFTDSSYLFELFIRLFSYLYMGLVTVYVACFIAPTQNRAVAVVTCGLVLIFSGATIFYAIMVPEYLGILDAIAMDLGAIGMATSIYNKQN